MAPGTGPSLPTGTVTLVFTDIEGSTRLLRANEQTYSDLLERQRTLVGEAFRRGVIFGFEGDAVFAAFSSPKDAVLAAGEAQRLLTSEAWPDGACLRVRMGIHTGTPRVVADDYVGLDVHRTARVCAAAHGAQVITSQSTRDLLTDCDLGVGFLDLGRHTLKDFEEPAPLYQLRIPGCPEAFPPPRTVEARIVALPREASSLIGRTSELGLLADEILTHRLVTLTGAGGSGKTKLAVRLGWNMAPRFRGPVVFVPLASLADASQLAGHLGRILAPGAAVSSWEEVLALLKDQHSLIILDNAEHLDGFGEHVRELVDSCDRAHLLVTSRSPLGASGERVFSVAPLDADDALSLLVERVRAHRVGFAPTAEENEFLRAIARRLDGLPLALELAAARLRALPPAALLRRLDRQLDLLTSESADLPPRQRTMRGAIQWSHDMLSGQDQALFASLAVFRSPAALSTVAALNQADEIQTLDGLTRLIDASLVRPGVAHTEPRYWMLEPIRQFAAERLHECGLDEILCRRLLSDLAEAASRAWADDADVFALFADEVDTVLNALEDAVALDEWNLGLTLADVVTRTVLVPMGVQTQLARWVDQAEQHRGSLNDIAQARLLRVGAWARILSLPEVLARWQEAAALLRDTPDTRLLAETWIGVAINASLLGQADTATEALAEAERLACSSPSLKAMAAMARAQFAAIAYQSDAPDLYRLADELATASGDSVLRFTCETTAPIQRSSPATTGGL